MSTALVQCTESHLCKCLVCVEFAKRVEVDNQEMAAGLCKVPAKGIRFDGKEIVVLVSIQPGPLEPLIALQGISRMKNWADVSSPSLNTALNR